MRARVAANPEPRAAELHENVLDVHDFFEHFAETVIEVAEIDRAALVHPCAFPLTRRDALERFLILGVDFGHRLVIAATVWVVLHRQFAIHGFDFVLVLAVVEIHDTSLPYHSPLLAK